MQLDPLDSYADGHELSLAVLGPFSVEEAMDCEDGGQPCVYIWTVDFRGRLVPYYIGETGKSFKERMKSHLRSYRTGEFGLLDWGAWQEGRIEKVKPSYYRKYTKELREEFEGKREFFEPYIEDEISRLRIFLVPLPGWCGRGHRAARMRIEQAIGQNLMAHGYPPGCATDLYPHDLDEYRRREHAANYVALLPETPIYGLARRL